MEESILSNPSSMVLTRTPYTARRRGRIILLFRVFARRATLLRKAKFYFVFGVFKGSKMARHISYCSVDDCCVSSRDCVPFFRCPKDTTREFNKANFYMCFSTYIDIENKKFMLQFFQKYLNFSGIYHGGKIKQKRRHYF